MLLSLFARPALAADLQSIVTSRAVERGRPVDVRSRFRLRDAQMYVWLHVTDAQTIELDWYRDDRFIIRNALTATGKDWRTWMRRRFRRGDAGAWRIDVRADGETIGSVEFAVLTNRAPADGPEPPPIRAAAPSSSAPPSTAPPSVPAPIVADVAATDGTCRALLNLRTTPEGKPAEYAVAEVRFGAIADIEHTPGLIVRDGKRFAGLAVRRRQHALRGWDEVLSLPLRSDRVTRWRQLPGAQPLPAPAELREDNRLTVLSILGPYVGLDARLQSALGAERTDNSRYLTVDSQGRAIDMRTLVGPGLEIMARNAGLPERFDYRQVALAPGMGLIGLLATERISMLSAPPAVRAVSPDRTGAFRRGRCAIKLAGHRIAASLDDAPFREIRAPRLLPYALLGVYWVEPQAPPIMEALRLAQRRLALHP